MSRKKVNCEYWVDLGLPNGGGCSIERFGKRPSHGVCEHCIRTEAYRSRGLGDVVAKVISKVMGKQRHYDYRAKKGCGCGGRQQRLNEAVSFEGKTDVERTDE